MHIKYFLVGMQYDLPTEETNSGSVGLAAASDTKDL